MIETDPALVATLLVDTSTALFEAGPPSGLPSPVPDFVGDLLGTIGSFIDGSIELLGEAVRAVTPGGSESSAAGGAGGPPGK